MKKKAFITGINGQDGTYLAKFLLKKEYKIFGLVKKGSSTENLDYFNIKQRLNLYYGNIKNYDLLHNLIKKIKPQEIYNFAAHSFVGNSWENVREVNEINYFAVIHLLDIIKKIDRSIKLYQASTAEMFGNSSTGGLQTEETPFHPRSPYAISKLAAYWIVNNYRETYNLFCSQGLCFNHESPIRPLPFVTKKISYGVAQIYHGGKERIKLGNLDSIRDWGFAGDYVKAMWLMLQQNKPDNYILSTGESHSIRDILNVAFNYIDLKKWDKFVTIDHTYSRPLELKQLYGSNSKAKKVLKWKPKVKFKQLIEMMVKADIERLRKR